MRSGAYLVRREVNSAKPEIQREEMPPHYPSSALT